MINYRCRLGSVGLLALLAAPIRGQAKCSLAYVTEVPLTLVHNRFMTELRIGGVTLPVMVDTGSNITTLSHTTAARVDLRVRPDVGSRFSSFHAHGIGGDREGSMMVAPHAHIGAVNAPDLTVMVPDGPRDSGSDPDLLGMNALTGFDIDFDLLGHRMVLFEGSGFCKHPPVLMSPPLYVVPMTGDPRNTHTYLDVTVAGRTLRAILDSGAHATVLTRGAAARVGLTDEILAGDRPFKSRGIGASTVQTVRHMSAPITVGDLTVSNVRVNIVDTRFGDADMLLGADFLSKVHFWLSNSTRNVVFQVPPTPSPPLPQDVSK